MKPRGMQFADRVFASDGRSGILLSKQIDNNGKAYWIVLEKLTHLREQVTFNAPESQLRLV